MSTVLLMTDTWHPTVLRLVPFSSNNAKLPERKPNGRQQNARGFPVLAVTRSGNKNNSPNSTGTRSAKSASTRSVQSARSDYQMDRDDMSEVSTFATTRRATTDRSEDFRFKHRKFPQKKIPVTHSEMKEAIKFSVQDLNDQMSSCSSMHSTDDPEVKERIQKADNTRTSLPKPSLCSPNEAKFFSPINGVRRSVPLTPGEMDLQRFRESYMVEQAQKRKKYKLNVNQLPRSNTPINDHDPDKLNMKQVIAFLQTKTPKDVNRKSGGERKSESHRSSSHVRKDSGVSTVTVRQKPPTEYEQALMNSENRYVDKVENTRQINGCVSVLSTKSTPNLPYGHRISRKEGTYATMSVRSYGNKSKEAKSTSRNKPAKEFKLYRFLAVAQEGESRQGLTTAVTESVPNVDVTPFGFRSQKNSSPDSPRKFLRKRARDTTTANLIHRRAVNRNGSLRSTSTKDQSDVSIRLPSMGESADDDSETCSTTSATYNSTKGSTNENLKLPKKEKAVALVEEKHEQKGDNKQEGEDENNNSVASKLMANFQIRDYRHDFPKVNINGPRQIHINMPQENKKPYSQEIVRLTLRQEKSTTRVNSYMSDIQTNSPDNWHELEKNEMIQDSNLDDRDWGLSTSRHLVNSLSNNNFIKVRQKLKSSTTTS